MNVYTGLPVLGRPRGTLTEFLRKNGQGLVEYALILSAIAILLIVILSWLGQVVFSNLYSKIGSGMQQAGG
jgi:Flp pilus assembly pilin Flp